jgi:hypothetical protein
MRRLCLGVVCWLMLSAHTWMPGDEIGVFSLLEVDQTALMAVKLAVGDHVQAAFTQERIASDAIDAALTVDDVLAIDIAIAG